MISSFFLLLSNLHPPPPLSTRWPLHSFLFSTTPAAATPMAYVDHAFSITDDDIMMDSSYIVRSKPPIKEIALAVALLVFGTLAIAVGILMAVNMSGGDRAHGIFFGALGGLLFIPGFYYTRIAYYAYKGYKGFSFANIPSV